MICLISRTLGFLSIVALVLLAALPALAQGATPSAPCQVIFNGPVTAYATADLASTATQLSAGDGGMVMGQSPDGAWIAFDPGIAQAGNLGVARARWVQASADISLQGDCASLPPLSPLPASGSFCMMTFGQATPAYQQPDTASPVVTTLTSNDTAMIAGQLASGWYAWSDPGASAGATGTILLHWIAASDQVQLVGACDALPVFYPVPAVSGPVCTILTGNSANTYLKPDPGAQADPLPGMLVQALARTDGWYGYDPAGAPTTVGIDRLRWIQASEADQVNGDCAALPLVDPAPIALTPADDGTAVSLAVGDTITLLLPGSPAEGQWVLDETTDSAILQAQGAPTFGPDGDRLGGRGAYTFTFQAIAAGPTPLALSFQPAPANGATPIPPAATEEVAPSGASSIRGTPAPLPTHFSAAVTVTRPARN